MNRKATLATMVLLLIGGTALLLAVVPQKLGKPGVKASPIPGDARWEVYLPEHVLDFASTNQAMDAETLKMLPKDTSFAQKIYSKEGAIPITSSVVLMGTDRTSIHKAEYCLQGQGMRILKVTRETVPMTQPRPYDLPIIKMIAAGSQTVDGKTINKDCVYVYWYVADGALSNDQSGIGRLWSTTKELVSTGVLQRWAYVRFYAFCDAGQEDATFAEIKKTIAAAVPQFQLTAGPATVSMAARR